MLTQAWQTIQSLTDWFIFLVGYDAAMELVRSAIEAGIAIGGLMLYLACSKDNKPSSKRIISKLEDALNTYDDVSQ